MNILMGQSMDPAREGETERQLPTFERNKIAPWVVEEQLIIGLSAESARKTFAQEKLP